MFPLALLTPFLIMPVFAGPTPGKLRVVENSGICETTPGVYQASGYADLNEADSLWFWFFAARKNPETAPLALWLNGGPGSSSMVGLLQENGPCRITNDSEAVSLNPQSWNKIANMLYIDQLIGTGFSHGSAKVNSSEAAAAHLWKFFQIFFSDERFLKYQKNDFAIWTESYGGHYGPVFASHFLEQNAAVANGTVSGVPINVKFLGIGDGITDPMVQLPANIAYAASNPYHPLVSPEQIQEVNTTYYKEGGCRELIASCYETNKDATCSQTQLTCNGNILIPLSGEYNQYDVRATDHSYPPDLYEYLYNETVVAAIGAENGWSETNSGVYRNFLETGDWMKTSRPALENLIDGGVRTLIYNGDADYMFNYKGLETMMDHLQTKYTSEWHQQPYNNYTVNGQITGIYKNAGVISYVRIFGAGHEVPAYSYGNLTTGEAALQMFSQIMSGDGLLST